MSITYTPTTNFGAKDSLPANDPAKVIKGAEFTTEYTAIQSAFALAAPAASPTITGTATFDDVSITNGLTVDGTTLVVDDTNNRVGIGTSSPRAILDVVASSGEAALLADSRATDNAVSRLSLLTKVSGSNSGGVFQHSGDLLTLSNSTNLATKHLNITSAGQVGIGTPSPQRSLHVEAPVSVLRLTDSDTAAYTEVIQDFLTTQIVNTGAGDIRFSNSGSERLRINSTGEVGIGVDAPERRLHVKKGAQAVALIESTTTSRCLLNLMDANTTGNTQVGIGAQGDDLKLYAGGSAERVTVDSTGNVGIGTSAPLSTLDVASARNTTLTLTSTTNDAGYQDQYYGQIDFAALDSSGAGSGVPRASIGAISPTSAGSAADLTFSTGSAAAPTERMRIDSIGNVAIGASFTSYKTQIVGTTSLAIDTEGLLSDATTTTVGVTAGGQSLNLRGSGTGNVKFSIGSSEEMRIDSSGNVLIGRTASVPATEKLFVESGSSKALGVKVGTGGTANFVQFYGTSDADAGSISATVGGTPAFAAASDERLKENITDHESELDTVMSLRPVRWDWKDEALGSGEGFIAQELQQTAWDDLVSEDADGTLRVSGLGSVETRMIKALQEAVARIESLEAEVEALKNA